MAKISNTGSSSQPANGRSKAAGVKEYTFFQDVYAVVRKIPKGKVTSYGAIAAYLGTKLSARMVGWAMNGAHNVKPKVPAQRVVNRNGMLTGKMHFATPTQMEELLKAEGVKVVDDTVINFKNIVLGSGCCAGYLSWETDLYT